MKEIYNKPDYITSVILVYLKKKNIKKIKRQTGKNV